MTIGLRTLAAVAIAAFGVAAATGSAAAADIHAEATLTGLTFPDAFLTDACGFDVTDTLNAFTTADAQLGAGGKVVFERDTWKGSWTYTSLRSGKSVTRALAAVVLNDYGAGAAVGSTGVSTARGYGSGTLLGGPPGAGIYGVPVQVFDFDASGIPFTFAIGPATVQRGNFDAETVFMCGALA